MPWLAQWENMDIGILHMLEPLKKFQLAHVVTLRSGSGARNTNYDITIRNTPFNGSWNKIYGNEWCVAYPKGTLMSTGEREDNMNGETCW